MPNRIIKDSICTSDSISKCSWFEEVLFYRLIVNCDDYGRFDGRMAVIKNRLFPLVDGLTTKNVEDAIKKLVSIGLVCRYQAQGKPFLYLPTWNEHQVIRAKRSKYPEPDSENNSSENICLQMISGESKCSRNPIQSNTNPIQYESNSNTNTHEKSVVLAAYMDKINATPSERCITELLNYQAKMGAECCLRAIDIALDAKKTSWNYIRAILQNKHEQGVKCLAEWDESEEQRQKGGANGGRDANSNPAGNSTKGRKWNIQSADLE